MKKGDAESDKTGASGARLASAHAQAHTKRPGPHGAIHVPTTAPAPAAPCWASCEAALERHENSITSLPPQKLAHAQVRPAHGAGPGLQPGATNNMTHHHQTDGQTNSQRHDEWTATTPTLTAQNASTWGALEHLVVPMQGKSKEEVRSAPCTKRQVQGAAAWRAVPLAPLSCRSTRGFTSAFPRELMDWGSSDSSGLSIAFHEAVRPLPRPPSHLARSQRHNGRGAGGARAGWRPREAAAPSHHSPRPEA